MMNHRAAAVIFSCALSAILLSAQTPSQPVGGPLIPGHLRARAEREGRVRVLVELKLPSGRHVAEGRLRSIAAIAQQRREILDAGTRVTTRLSAAGRRIVHRYQTVPYVALDVSPAALAALEASDDVARVFEDQIVRPVLAESVPLIEGDQAWAAGYDGTGTTVAIIDTGVDSTHPFLANKVVSEACYSSTIPGRTVTTCPNGTDQQIGPGSAPPCVVDVCLHGTHVAGIAAGNGGPAGVTFSGVGKGANIVAVQVFTEITDPATCGSIPAPCAGALSSDIIAGLERVYALAPSLNIVSANMSLGGSSFSAPCDSEPYKPAIDNLRSINVATVVAAGNDGSGSTVSSPGCISSAISVGSIDKQNNVSTFSNVASFMSLFAPGTSITSSVPGGGYRSLNGTSMATPHVTGTWAILRQAVPSASVSLVLDSLRRTGLPITDNRPGVGAGVTVPRVSIFEALNDLRPAFNPLPALTAVAPSRLRATTLPVSLALTGTGFNALTIGYVNGAARPTSVLSATQMQVQTAAADLASAGTAHVSVATPAPGGGTSGSLTITIDPPPTLAVSATSVAPSSPVTVTLANGFGGSGDWLSLAAVGSPASNYVAFTYVGAGITSRTWTVNMPATPGQYEFRLLPNNNYTIAATSPTITVDTAVNPSPSISSLSPSSGPAGGAAFTLTVNGNGFAPASIVRWNGSPRTTTFVSATQVQAAIPATDLASTGTAAVTVFSPTPGGGTSSSLTFTIAPPPAIAVNATTVQPGASVTATLTNGTGGVTDWLALAPTSAANSSYITYVYVGSGVTTRSWTVTMPTTPGTYEFRYFPNGGFTRTATSPTVTVQAGGGGTPSPVISSLSPSSVVAGSGAFTLTVNGSGFTASSTVRWNGADRTTTFSSPAKVTASIAAADVASAGSASVTVSVPGVGTSAPQTFLISSGSGPGGPSLSVGAASVSAGTPITVTLTNGLGGSGDWLAFALTSASNSSYAQFTYVGAGVTTRTWTVTAPSVAGTYEFRLFPNNGFTRAATSSPITVTAPAPTLTVSATTVAPGASVTVTLTNGAGGPWDWLALAATSASNTNYITYTFVGSGVSSRTWTVTMPTTPGTYEFRLFLNNGYARAATSPPVTVQ
jgi:subtilisin family serine protease